MVLAALLIVEACGADNPTSPDTSASAAGSLAPSAAASSAGAPPAVTGTASASAPVPTLTGFWTLAARALSRSGRLRLVLSGTGRRELRFEPRASGVVTGGSLVSACLAGAAYTITGRRATAVPGKWACGGSALASGFRKSGQPVYAWNTRLPADSRIKESVSVASKGRWQWDYAATSKALGGTVTTSLTLDVATGRLVSGTRTDPKETTRYTFSYTTILAPIALP